MAKVSLPTKESLFDYGLLLDQVEKKFKLSSNMSDRFKYAMSSGLLVNDLILGGGLIAGGMYTIAGMEQSAKSTSIMTFLAAQLSSGDAPDVMLWMDAEGSLSSEYLHNMMDVKAGDSEIFGIKNREGKYIIAPRIRYYPENRGEIVMNAMNAMLRNMPDKEVLDDQWFYVFENTKINQKLVAGKYSKALFTKYNKFYVEAENGGPQAIITVDSWPALVPESQDDEDKGSGLGASARFFSEHLPKIKGKLRRKAAVLLGVNQLREKPMVMYGCFQADTLVTLADESVQPISIVANRVENGEKVYVKSYDLESKKFVSALVVTAYKNGYAEKGDFLRVIVSNSVSTYSMVVTPNHMVLPYGSSEMVNIGTLKVGDRLTSPLTSFGNIEVSSDARHTVLPSEIVSIEEYELVSEQDDDSRVKFDLEVEGTHTYIAGNCIVHNSPLYEPGGNALRFNADVRLWNTSRAIPHGKGQIEEEESVLTEGGTDKYRYVHTKAVKNKLSTPGLEGFSRLWVSDAEGKAHGFDTVWDTFSYMRMTGQIDGTMKKMNLNIDKISLEKISFYDLKCLILLKGKDLKEYCTSLGLERNPKIRERCFEQMKSGKGTEMYYSNLVEGAGGEEEEADEYDDED